MLVALVLGAAAAPATAVESDVTFGIAPGTAEGPDGRERLEYTVAPGTEISDWVSVTNSSAADVSLRVVAQDGMTDYDTGAFTLVGTSVSSENVGAWTSVGGGASTCPADAPDAAACLDELGVEVSLRPGERANIPFRLTVPHDATPGDHAGGIAAIYTTTRAGEGGISTPVEVHAGTRIYLRVDGPLSPGLAVTGLVSGYDGGWNPFAGGTGRLGFDVVNGGNTRLSAEPRVELTGPFGISFGAWTLPAVENIVPGQSAHVAAELPGIPPLLLMFADLEVTPVPGDGTAASADEMPEPTRLSTTAWAVPWAWLTIVVVLGGGTALVVWLRRRARSRLATDLAAYTERVRAEERARTAAEHAAEQATARPATDPSHPSAPEQESEPVR
ncbi:hypothetical protein [Microbacterium album]|uniref:DUF916 domain-containing protein n=1 Tax=Microbacterium album TaxID=2053191 RepID=A0A917IH45_9MICO|nr:hypothetical protein [Microbacterium album]GGH51104.1 hypothetical protein GCM10010921_30320 [Microbacterium album]